MSEQEEKEIVLFEGVGVSECYPVRCKVLLPALWS